MDVSKNDKLHGLKQAANSGDEFTASSSASVPAGMFDQTTDHLIGSLVEGKYKVLEVIGAGGMGRVYKVLHVGIDKVLAMKTINRQCALDEMASKRFHQEAKTASALTHGNLVHVQDYGITRGGDPYLVMEYLDGVSLSRAAKGAKTFDCERFLPLFREICDGMAHAHRKGVIHRDLKSSNIILVKDEDGKEHAKVLDFGVAKLSAQPEGDELTRSGEILGSPRYMSPEQGLGRKLDARADIYSFGCVMFEVISGRTPFVSETAMETVLKHVNEQPPALQEVCPGTELPERLSEIVMKCLSKKPEDRYESFDALKADLLLVGRPRPPVNNQCATAGSAARGKRPLRLYAGALLLFLIACVGAGAYYRAMHGKKVAPPAVPDIAKARGEYIQACVAQKSGDLQGALPWYKQAAADYEAAHSTHAPDYATLLLNYANCLRDTGHPAEALDAYNKAYDASVSVSGKDSLRVALLGLEFSKAYAQLGRYGDAENACKTVVDMLSKNPDASAKDLADAKLSLANVYRLSGRYKLAQGLYESVLLKDGSPIINDQSLLPGLESYAQCLIDLKRKHDGEFILEQAIAMRRSQHLPRDRKLAKDLARLGELYEEDLRFHEAQDLVREAHKIE